MESTRKAIDEIIDVVALECKGRVVFIVHLGDGNLLI
jgi:hypothetical protein